jgi:hypothetical protein
MRGSLAWIVAILAGIAVVLVVTAMIGTRDDKGETVTAGEWAQSTCGAVGVWRGAMEDIVEELRTPSAFPASGAEEPQSETPQGRTGFVRVGLERAVQATDTMIEGVDNAGTPDTPEGRRRGLVSDWSDSALDDLGGAGLARREADSFEDRSRSWLAPRARCSPAAYRRSRTSRASTRACKRCRTRAPVSSFRRRRAMTTMDWILVAVQGLVVIGFIALGVRAGGIGLGLWGGVGTLVLVFVFGLDPGEPPISAMLIIIAVVSAAAAMQAAGGVDYMVLIASGALRARPKALNFAAPYVSYLSRS